MKFVKATEEEIAIPKHNNKLKEFLNEFMASGDQFARVELSDDEYKNIKSANNCLSYAAKRHGFPVHVIRRGDNLYLIRRDI